MSISFKDLVRDLGGLDNVTDVESCITRVRTEVADPALVDTDALRSDGAYGVVIEGATVQIVVGPDAETLAEEMTSAAPLNELMESA